MGFSAMQRAYFAKANRRWNIKCGATRSGKTYMDYFLLPKRIRAAMDKEGLIVLLGNTKGTLQRNIIEPMQRIWGKALVSDIRADNTAFLFGTRVHCLGADKQSQVNRLRGSGISYCYGDEVTTWNEAVFTMLKSRLDKPYSRFDGTCNPDSPNHWFKRFLESDANIFLQNYTIDDNPYLPSGVVAQMKREYSGTVFYDRYILGKWTLAEGLVYQQFQPEKHLVDFVPQTGKYYISVDYGTANPCSMGLWCVQSGVAYRVNEFYHDSRIKGLQMTDAEYYEALCRLAEGFAVECVIVDPSAASFKALIRKMGRFSVRNAKNDVLNGIQQTALCLQNGALKFHVRCKDTVREFQSYRWDSNAQTDKVIKENDHAMDDIRYFVHTVLCPFGVRVLR